MSDTPCQTCGSDGELIKVMNEVAQQAADRAVAGVEDRIRLELLQTNDRLRRELMQDLDSRLNNSLGMSVHKHAIQHAALDDMIQTRKTIFRRVVSEIAKYALVGLIATGATAVAVGKADPTPVPSNQQQQSSAKAYHSGEGV